MTIPYTYLIKHIPTNTYYYGVRFAKGCNPSEFWNKYKTSSKYVKQLIEKYGEDSFEYEIRKTFTNIDIARKWESTVLRRLNVINRIEFINKTDNISISLESALKGNTGRIPSEKFKKAISKIGKANLGRKQSDEVNKKKAHPGNTFKTGKKDSIESRQKKRLAKLGKPSNAIGNYQPKCSCITCHKPMTSATIKKHLSFYHNI